MVKANSKDVNFIRTPASMNPLWEQGARGYYVSEALGIRKKPIFRCSMRFMRVVNKFSIKNHKPNFL
jgi:thiol:disulfide interchange protein DsbA